MATLVKKLCFAILLLCMVLLLGWYFIVTTYGWHILNVEKIQQKVENWSYREDIPLQSRNCANITESGFKLINSKNNYQERTESFNPLCKIQLAPWTTGSIAKKIITVHQWRQLIVLMSVVDVALTSYGIPYFIFGGALYGSYMMHDLLPWDDDIDILISKRHDQLVRKILPLDLGPEYLTVNHTNKKYLKTFFTKSPKKWKYNWVWPFLDVNFYETNETHVWETGRRNDRNRCYPIDIVFPLHRRPLGSLWIPSPKDTRTFLVRSIRFPDKSFKCGPQGWMHQEEHGMKKHLVSCMDVMKEHAVVHRRAATGGILETLMFKNEALHTCFVLEPECSVTKYPLSFELAT